MWWKSRTPQREKLGETTCTEQFLIKMSIINNGFSVYMPIWKVGEIEQLSSDEMAELARLDGFGSIQEMTEWFYKTHGEINQDCFQVIRWDDIPSVGVK
jgi:hypothetical protein